MSITQVSARYTQLELTMIKGAELESIH